MKFLLDTNFLMLQGKFKVDIFSELEKFGKVEAYTINLVVNELEKIAGGRGKNAMHAKVAIWLIRKEGVKILHSKGRHADPAIKRFAANGYYAVCTQDKKLRDYLKKKKIPVVFLRQKKYLVML